MMIGKVLADRYEIIEKIGGGGMALVYKARCRLLNRFVAIKILRAEFTEDEEFVKKFKREAQSAASLSHPNIVGIYDVGKEDGIHYIVMEYVKGQTLKDLIKSKGSIGIDQATTLAIQISSAIEHAHKNHIVHRDIKSHNILIREDNSVKVTDFGIARAVSSCTITNTGNIIGSVHYFSPEQARGGYTDEKSDIYSLGVVMYEMVTGVLPFEGESPIAIALKHIQETPVKPSKINSRIPRSIEDIILKCMEKDVNNRYNTAGEIINDLRQSLVMPNGTFVKRRTSYEDENTKVIEPIKAPQTPASNPVSAQKLTNEINELLSKGKGEEEEEKEKPKKKKSKVWIAVAIIGGLIAAFALGGGLILLKGFTQVKEVVVPDITKQTEEAAQDMLKSVGLNMEVIDRVTNPDYPEGTVISQDPKANARNKITNNVQVVISKGPRQVVVPNLIGKNYDEVKYILESKGLKEGEFTQEPDNQLPIGTVKSQSVEANTEVDEGTVVDYVISMGPEKFPMPYYIGQNMDMVKVDLAKMQLILGNIVPQYSDTYPENTVINQSINAGDEVKKNDTVDFVVSQGKEPVVQPPTHSLQVPLPNGLENARITITKTENGETTKIYEEFKNSSDSPLLIPVTGEGVVTFEIYINGTFLKSEQYDFGQQ